MRLRIEVKAVKAREIKPGDLFSTASLDKWADVNYDIGSRDPMSLGEQVFIRNNVPLPKEQEDTTTTLVTIHMVDDLIAPHVFTKDEDGSCAVCKDLKEASSHQVEPTQVPCPNCKGRGSIDDETCTVCDGTGTAAKEDPNATVD